MPSFSTELFEVRVRQQFLGQELINLYYYTETAAGGNISPGDLCTAFNDDVMRDVEAVQQEDVIGIDIRCRKFGGVSETILDISSQSGVRTGGPSPSFNAWGFILNRATIDIRNGAKRYGGLSENDTVGNDPDPAMLALLATLAGSIAATLTIPGPEDAKPVIYRRDSFVDPDWFGGNVSGASFTKVTSQVSRKFEVE